MPFPSGAISPFIPDDDRKNSFPGLTPKSRLRTRVCVLQRPHKLEFDGAGGRACEDKDYGVQVAMSPKSPDHRD